MKIEVVWSENQFAIFPSPAIVTVGTLIEWGVTYTGKLIQELMWTIYFDNGSPFPGKVTFRISTLNIATTVDDIPSAPHTGIIDAGKATTPGDWKYGVRLQDGQDQMVLGDYDPYLKVCP